MKAILSLVILLGSVNVFAQSADMRIDAIMRQQLKDAHEKQVCAKNPEYCQLKAEIIDASNKRFVLANKYETAAHICWGTKVRRAELMGNDGVVQVVYTPCEKIVEYNQKLSQNQVIAAKIRAYDATIAEMNERLNYLKSRLVK